MASSNNCSNPTTHGSDTTTSTQANTTFVQADPSNFRTIVQKLTGAVPPPDDDWSHHKLPVTGGHHQNKPTLKRPAFKLYERRQTTNNYNNYNNLNLSLNNNNHTVNGSFLFSPISTLDFLSTSRTNPGEEYKCDVGIVEEAEQRAIAEKGFYLHPVIVSPLLGPTPRRGSGGGAHDPPQLLPLFPLTSPRDGDDDDH